MWQAGFGILEAGSVRARNTRNILLKNLLDACIGAHNLGVFARGCAALAGGVAVEGVLFAQRASHRRVWGAEAALAWYALLIVIGLLLLLANVAVNLARGATAHQLRRLRRSGGTLPPLRWANLSGGSRKVLCCE